MIQRIRDWRLERQIKRHGDACKARLDEGDKVGAQRHWLAMTRLIAARSSGQVERMERKIFARGVE